MRRSIFGFIVFLLFLVFVSNSKAVYASCAITEQHSLEENVVYALQHDSAIFSGKAIDVEKQSGKYITTFLVYNSWKGVTTGNIAITSYIFDPEFTLYFTQGEEYLVFARTDNSNELVVDGGSCGGMTMELKQAQDDIQILNSKAKHTTPIVTQNTKSNRNSLYVNVILGIMLMTGVVLLSLKKTKLLLVCFLITLLLFLVYNVLNIVLSSQLHNIFYF